MADSAPDKFLLVRNDDGIALSDLASGQTTQLIFGFNYLTGIEYDAGRRQLFWANSDGNYSCLGTATLNNSLNGIVPGSLNTRLTKRLGLPAGIALDTAKQLIYCADYEQQKLLLFDYRGNEVTASITQHSVGSPSSIELDPRNQVLYWTDIAGRRINRLFLGLDSIEYGFISESGTYPDGLSLDLEHNTIWWASNTSKEIGYGRIDKTESVKIKVPYPTTAVEIDPTTKKLYCSIWNSDLIRTMVVEDPYQKLPVKYQVEYTLSAGGFSPGVIKLIDLSE
jgi:DNA-binding beta-propeller fold protein YncE